MIVFKSVKKTNKTFSLKSIYMNQIVTFQVLVRHVMEPKLVTVVDHEPDTPITITSTV